MLVKFRDSSSLWYQNRPGLGTEFVSEASLTFLTWWTWTLLIKPPEPLCVTVHRGLLHLPMFESYIILVVDCKDHDYDGCNTRFVALRQRVYCELHLSQIHAPVLLDDLSAFMQHEAWGSGHLQQWGRDRKKSDSTFSKILNTTATTIHCCEGLFLFCSLNISVKLCSAPWRVLSETPRWMM